MSAKWQEVLRSVWTELALHSAQSRQFRSRRLSEELSLDIYGARRAADNAPCLIIEAAISTSSLFELGGMRLEMVRGENGPLSVLSLEDDDSLELFITVCADAITAAEQAERDNSLACFLARIDAWRRFLKDRRAGLSRPETVGLLGELLVLERIVEKGVTFFDKWESPNDGLHDFLNAGHALEVKSSLGVASGIHINSLDQLETIGLRRLDLVHVRLLETADGRSLQNIIVDLKNVLPDDAARRVFENTLLRRGLMPDDTISRSTPQVQLRSMSTYAIGSDFPRLMKSEVPTAVVEANYVLELRAIESHLVDSDGVFASFTADFTS